MKYKNSKEQLDLMTKNPDNWKWGLFYFNPLDPRMIVPKRKPGLGGTINCASPKAWFIFLGTILFVSAVSFFF